MQVGNAHHLELPTQLRHKLETYRRRVWMVKLAEGVLAGIFGLLVSYLLVFVLDRFGDTPAWLRLLLLLTGVTVFALGIPLKWHRWVWQTRQLEQAARLLRHHFPRIGDQLLGIVELAHNELEQERSEALCQAAMRQVDHEVRDCDFRGAVPHPRHRHWAWGTGLVMTIAAAALVIVPAASTNALARWLFPWRDTPRYTFVQLSDIPDQMVVPYAEPFQINARLATHSQWKPQSGSAQYGRQNAVEASLNDDRYQFSLPPQKDPDALTIAIGDARKQVHIAPTSRPELTEVMAHIELPEYLRYDSYPDQDVRSGSLSVIKGSRVAVSASVTRGLSEATLGDQSLTTVENLFRVPPTLIADSQELTMHWRDELGLSAKEPFHLRLTAVEDDAPTVTCVKLPREQVILSTDTTSFEVLARDDFGVKTVGIQWQGIADPVRNPHPAQGEHIVAVGAPEKRELNAKAAFSTERLRIEPQSLEVRLFAIDYLPGRERVYSPTYIFHVLSPEEHAIWLTHQLRRWYQRANEVYEREQQLYAENKAIRALSAEQLDKPQTRRRIETQAAAEQANARRLGTLAMVGEELVKQATRNKEFNVATLETWAEMLQALKKIADKRMPSVADLLSDAANAPGAAPPKPPSPPASDSKTPPQVGKNRDPRTGPPGKTKPAKPSAVVPQVVDVESGFNELDKPKETDASEKKPGQPQLRLPGTAVVGGGSKPKEDAKSCPAKKKVEEAVAEQEDLLAEFARVADELKKLLGDLEGSTFVKRLKAASRRQIAVAKELNESVESGFGLNPHEAAKTDRERLAKVADREIQHGDDIYVIEDDLEAYFNRVQEGKFKTVLNEMKSTHVVSNLHGIAKSLRDNMNGQSIADAEFWADTLDRWAEQLVGPG